MAVRSKEAGGMRRRFVMGFLVVVSVVVVVLAGMWIGQYPYQREDGVLVVPIGCMGS